MQPTEATRCAFPECDRPRRSRGYCGGHYEQVRLGIPLRPLRKHVREITLAQRMESCTDKSGDCWTWTGDSTPDGYGLVGREGRTERAHRVAYEMVHGPIPGGLVIDHLCHNPACVRVDHLHAVTLKENSENRAGSQRNSSSGVRGVVWIAERQKWRAAVSHLGRYYFAGYFDSIDEASDAAAMKRSELFTNNMMDR